MDFTPEDIEAFGKLTANLKDLNAKVDEAKARVGTLSSMFDSSTKALSDLMKSDVKLSDAKISQIGYSNLLNAAMASQAAQIAAQQAVEKSQADAINDKVAQKKEALASQIAAIRSEIQALQESKASAEPGTKGEIKRKIKALREEEARYLALEVEEFGKYTTAQQDAAQKLQELTKENENNTLVLQAYTGYLKQLIGSAQKQIEASNQNVSSLLARVEKESAVTGQRANVDDRSETMRLIDRERDALQSSVNVLQQQVDNYGDTTQLSGEQKKAADALLSQLEEAKARLGKNIALLDSAYSEAAKTNMIEIESQALKMNEAFDKAMEREAAERAKALDKMLAKEFRNYDRKTAVLNAITGALEKIANALFTLDKAIRDNQKALGTSYGDSFRILFERIKTSVGSFFSKGPLIRPEDLKETQEAFGSAFGGVLSTEAAAGMFSLSKSLNISPQAFMGALRPLSTIFGGIDKAQNRLVSVSKQFIAAGLRGNDAAKFIADNSEIFARNGDRFAAGMTRAAIEAQKAGYSLQGIEGFGDRVVTDFEGFLTDFTALAAMGIDFNVPLIAQASLSGNTEELKNVLQSEFRRLNIDPDNMNRAVRAILERALTQPLSQIMGIKQAPETAQTVTSVVDKAAAAGPSESDLMFEKSVTAFALAVKIFAITLGAVVGLRALSSLVANVTDGKGFFGFGKRIPGATPPGGTPPVPPGAPGSTPGGAPGGDAASQASKFSAKNVLAGAFAMLIVAGAVYVLAKALQEFNTVEIESIGKGAAGLGVLYLAMKGLSKIPAGDLLKVSGAMILVSFATGVLGRALQEFNDVDFSSVFKSSIALLGLIFAMRQMNAISTTTILKTAGSMIALGLSMGIFATGIGKFNDVDWGSIFKATGAIAGIAGAMMLFQKISIESILKTAGSMLAIGFSLDTFAKGISSFTNINWEDIAKAGVSMGGLAVGMKAFSKIDLATIAKSAGSMLVIGFSLDYMASGLKNFTEVNWESIGKAAGSLVSLAGGMYAFSKIPAAAVGKAAGAMMLGGFAMSFLAKGFSDLDDVSWESLAKAGMVLLGLGIGLAVIGTLLTGPQILGVLGFAAALGLVSLAIMGIAKAFEIASRGFEPFGRMIESFGRAYRTVFEGLATFVDTIMKRITDMMEKGFQKTIDLITTLGQQDAGNLFLIGPALVSVAGGLTAIAGAQALQGLSNLATSIMGIGSAVFDRLAMLIRGDDAIKAAAVVSGAPATQQVTLSTDLADKFNEVTTTMIQLTEQMRLSNANVTRAINRPITVEVTLDGQRVGRAIASSANGAATPP